MAVMTYFKEHVIERSGLPDRTIRNYIKRGLLPPPVGHGLGAEYSEEHMLRAVTIGRMRAQGIKIDAIAEQIAAWSNAKFKRFVADTEPQPTAAAPAAPPTPPEAPEPAALRGEIPPRAELPPRGVPQEATIERHDPIGDATLSDGPCFRIVSLLPGLGLMLDVDAPPIVRRIAAEICERYGQKR
jgi:DNA-binding transcriptional MerR regulator